MRKFYRYFLAVMLVFLGCSSVWGQQRFFSGARQNGVFPTSAKRDIVPNKYNATVADINSLKTFLWSLPSEDDVKGYRGTPKLLELPMPDGSLARFNVWESSIQQPGLAAAFPDMKTFAGQGIDDKTATVRMDYSPEWGFHAQILSANGSVYIDPYARFNTQHYISYRKSDMNPKAGYTCAVVDNFETSLSARIDAACRGTELRTYRLAVANTGEYAVARGATTANALHSAILTSVNRVTGVYERELAIRLVLVNNNNLIEYLSPTTDQFTQNSNPGGLLDESQTVINSIIGAANYDIGHTFCSANSGIATLRSVCQSSSKARGVTGHPNPVGDPFDIDYVAHEMGHQFGAEHTFNTSTCFSAGGSYEVGGGTTIMAYAGICGANENIQPNSDDIFHGFSYDQIINFITNAGGANCGTVSAITNNLPVVTIVTPNNLSIPVNTPFTLEASATDADGDMVTYNWEGWDIGPANASWLAAATSSVRPLFRTRTSKTVGTRTFPDMRVIMANYPGVTAPSIMDGLRGEVLPAIARDMRFRVTVRDNKAGGGGVVSAGGGGCQNSTVFVVSAVGTTPFRVLIPNGGQSYPGGSQQTITWDVAGSNAAPINTANVRISFSTDGFVTSTVLAASTPNDGSESLTIPVGLTSTARIRIEAIGNIFFDISDQNFSVTAPVNGYEFTSPAPVTIGCNGPTSVAFNLGSNILGGAVDPIALSATGNPPGTTVSFGANPLTAGTGTTVTINGTNTLSNGTYVVTVSGNSNGQIRTRELTFTIQAGTAPTINTAPTAQAVCIGTDATFNVAASGATGYQWQVSTNGGNSFANVAANGNGTSYTVTGVTAGLNNNQYRVIVTGQCNAVTSTAVTLTAQQAPAISAAPQTVTLCESTNASFNVTATGTTLAYQWQLSTDAGANYNNVVGANSASYTVNNITPSQNGNRYRVVVSGTCAPAATSAAATLNVVSPVQVTTDPIARAECVTGNVSFTVAGAGSNIIYAWQSSADNGTSWQNVTNGGNYSGATTATLSLTDLPANFNNYRYRALLSNNICTTPDASAAAVLTVNPRPTVALAATRLLLEPGQESQITATIMPAPTGFAITWYRNDQVIPGVNGTSYTANVTTLGNYKVSIINPTTGCNNESAVTTIGAQSSSRLFVFPSPNNGLFTVSYYNASWSNQRQTIAIYDSKGARVYSSILNLTGPYTLHPINLGGHASGIYHVVLGDASGKKITETKVMIGY